MKKILSLSHKTDALSETKTTLKIYQTTAEKYDTLDEQYEKKVHGPFRSNALNSVSGKVLEGGVGTGHNLQYYPETVTELHAFDLCQEMIEQAQTKNSQRTTHFKTTFFIQDATNLNQIPSNTYDFYVATYMFNVLPNNTVVQTAIDEIVRVLKPGGKFIILDITASKDPKIKEQQEKGIKEKLHDLYGLNISLNTLQQLENHTQLRNVHSKDVRNDTFRLITGNKT